MLSPVGRHGGQLHNLWSILTNSKGLVRLGISLTGHATYVLKNTNPLVTESEIVSAKSTVGIMEDQSRLAHTWREKRRYHDGHEEDIITCLAHACVYKVMTC